MSIPAVSVCIPAHNGEAFIAETIGSVLRQEWCDFELVVVDDSSTDRTAAVVAGFDDFRIRYIRRAGSALASNWRHAVDACRAPLVKLLCQDDVLYPTCLRRQVGVLHGDVSGRIALVCSTRDIVDQWGHRLLCRRGWRGPDRLVRSADVVRRIARRGANVLGEPLVGMFRKDTYMRCGGFSDSIPYCIDVDLWCRLLEYGDLYLIDEPAGAFRVSQHSLSWSLRGGHAAQDREFLTRLRSNPVVAIRPWETLLGHTCCTVDSVLRQAFYTYLRCRRQRPTRGPSL